MKFLPVLLVVLLTACGDNPRDVSYEQLKQFPKDCSKVDVNLNKLTTLQHSKGFKEDPDELTDEDRAYNALLKETVWWYRRECDMI